MWVVPESEKKIWQACKQLHKSVSLPYNFHTNQITQPLPSIRFFSIEIQYCVTVLKGLYPGKMSFLSQVQDIHKVAFWTGTIRQSERQHIPRIHFTGVSVPILALQLTAGLEFCMTSSKGSCYDRVRAREGHFMAVKQRYMMFPLPKISACLRVVKSSEYTPHTASVKPGFLHKALGVTVALPIYSTLVAKVVTPLWDSLVSSRVTKMGGHCYWQPMMSHD